MKTFIIHAKTNPTGGVNSETGRGLPIRAWRHLIALRGWMFSTQWGKYYIGRTDLTQYLCMYVQYCLRASTCSSTPINYCFSNRAVMNDTIFLRKQHNLSTAGIFLCTNWYQGVNRCDNRNKTSLIGRIQKLHGPWFVLCVVLTCRRTLQMFHGLPSCYRQSSRAVNRSRLVLIYPAGID